MKHHSLDHSHQILTLKSAEFWFDSLSWQVPREIFSSIFNDFKVVKMQSWGWGFFCWIASAQTGEKNPHPPGGFSEEPLQTPVPSFFF